MAVFAQLGLNETFFYQLVIFCVAYVTLSRLVFIPYTKALAQREDKTKGGEEMATELRRKSQDLRVQYETKARQVSGGVRTIFDDYRTQATREYEQMVAQARAESQKLIEEARRKVNVEIGDAQNKIKTEVALVAQEMTQKLLAK